MTQPKLVIIDDEAVLAQFVADVASSVGYEPRVFTHAQGFMQDFRDDIDVIMLDLFMPDIDGVEVLRFLSDKGCSAQIILISGHDSGVLHSAQKLAIEQKLHYAGSLSKPFRHHELCAMLELHPGEENRDEVIVDEFVLTADDLRIAMNRDQITVHYQPKINLQTNRAVGVEALVRWQHPDYGLIGPDRFIPIAEAHNLIDELTWEVMRKVAQESGDWRSLGYELSVAINMSAATLKELSLPENMEQMVRELSLEPLHITFEVTETALMQELIKSLDILTRLRMKGFKLSIDDFGTGYSSLVQLYRAPFSELKIDRSFVQDMATDREAFSIVETVILLGHKLGMSVVAEGVETLDNLDKIRELGCDLAQGFYISRPKPVAELLKWLNKNGQPLKSASA